MMSISIKDEDGRHTYFKLTNTVRMGEVFDTYLKGKDQALTRVRFLLDGRNVWEEDTPIDIELQDQDVIDCVEFWRSGSTIQETTGGAAAVVSTARARAAVAAAERARAAHQRAQVETGKKRNRYNAQSLLRSTKARKTSDEQALGQMSTVHGAMDLPSRNYPTFASSRNATGDRTERSKSTEGSEATGNTESTEDKKNADDMERTEDVKRAKDTEISDDAQTTEDTEVAEDEESMGDMETANDTESTDDLRSTDDAEVADNTERTEIPACVQTMLEDLQEKNDNLQKAQSELNRRVLMLAPLMFLAGLLPTVLWAVLKGSREF
ncbi:unnamed protein product [Scytosiphon promiscuus]